MSLIPARLSPLHAGKIAAVDPATVALRARCGTLTYGDLDARAARLAALLAARGIGPQSLVGICLERSFDQIVAILATWKTGAAILPIDPAWPDARLRLIVADAACGLVIGSADVAPRLGSQGPAVVEPDMAAGLADAAPTMSGDPDRLAPDRLAYVIYTSGSTGVPKGVEITHANLAGLIAWHVDAFDVTAADRASHLAGPGFDAAVWEVWPYLSVGASVSLIGEAARTSGSHLRDWLVAEGITIAFAPTALADELIAADWPAATPLRVLLTGADRLLAYPPAGLPFTLVNNYGPTECTVVATSGPIAPAKGERFLPPIGRPIAGTTIHILDEAGAPVQPGEIGEIHIGGVGVGRGYLGRPDLTAERFLPDPFATAPGARLYRTGDRGAWLDDGQIACHGRIDDQAKIRGHRIEPEEIASVLRDHPAVRACTVATFAQGDGEPRLGAWLVLADAEAPSAEAIGAWLGDRLPDYMIPAAFVRIEALPLTANGKIDRKALPDPGPANALASAGFAAPETPAQARLAEILAEVLGRGAVGIDDNFFLLGGHSLLGTQVVLRAGAAFGIDITLRHLFLAPTIRQLAGLIEEIALSMLESLTDEEAQLRAAE